MKSKILATALLALSCLFVSSIAAFAADLGGKACCADIEERIAELEATAAKKGNRKVTLTISGQVNQQLLIIDTPDGTEKGVAGNGLEQSRVRFIGEGRISPDLKAGYVLEVGIDTLADAQTSIRHGFVYLDSATAGRLSLGRTSQATDGIVEISVANTASVSKPFSLSGLPIEFDLGFDGSRRDVVRYDTPALMGVTLSAAWADGGDQKDISARYAGELLTFKIAAGVGYREEANLDYFGACTPVPPATNCVNPTRRAAPRFFGGSVSVMETTTGLFVTGAYGRKGNVSLAALFDDTTVGKATLDGYHVTGGIERNFTGYGKTTLMGEYGLYSGSGAELMLYGLGAVQSFDAAALDIYAGWQHMDADEKVDVMKVGAIVKF